MNRVISKIRITELDSLSDTLVRLYKDNAPLAEDAFLKSTMAELETLSAQITTAIKSDKVRSRLDEADSGRDEAVKNLGRALDGYAALPIAGKKAAAERLLETFAKYGKDIAAANYSSESSLIESLLEDFGTADAKAAAVELDGISEILSDIRSAEDAFKKANDEFTAAKSEKGESASSFKKTIVALINDKLVPYLTAMAIANSAVYSSFASKTELEITRQNSIIAKRGK